MNKESASERQSRHGRFEVTNVVSVPSWSLGRKCFTYTNLGETEAVQIKWSIESE